MTRASCGFRPTITLLNKVEIASVPDWTDSRQWNKYSTQKSAPSPITLTAGQRYYVEALQKEGGGGDNLAVGWAKPGESTSAPSEVIPSSGTLALQCDRRDPSAVRYGQGSAAPSSRPSR